MINKPTTEQPSHYNDLEKMTTKNILENMNKEDSSVPKIIDKEIPNIQKLIDVIVPKMKKGGRLFYIGAGTSGRLGVLDASECPPTFGVSQDLVIGLIAGGDGALRKAVEKAEDDKNLAWEELKEYQICEKDVLIGIAASGTTPYVIGGLEQANKKGIVTACIVCNQGSPVAKEATYPIELVVGPEFLTGSTRLKAGTAQKLVLNMISTAVMIQLGRVVGNKMIHMQLSNNKLVNRAVRMIMDDLDMDENKASLLLAEHKSIKKVLDVYKPLSND